MHRLAWWFLSLALVCTACDRAAPSPTESAREQLAQPAPEPVAVSATPPLAKVTLSSRLVHPGAELVLAFGDVHGDLDATKRVLRLAGAIDEHNQWIGGARVLVHTGDSIDRGDADRAVLDLLVQVRDAARKAGGDLLLLSGNHELMNVQLDFRYVAPDSFFEFGGPSARAEAFRPAGPYARMLAERPILMKVGDTLFVHGGILPKHVRYGLDRMNDEVRAWMIGERTTPPEIVVAEDGPVWTRLYGGLDATGGCRELTEVLTALDAKRMVVGHTVQKTGVTSACDDRLFRIDVGMSRAYGGTPQVLEIKAGAVKVLKEPS